MMETAKFEVGKTYYDRSACDHECIYTYTVISRTAKTVILENDFGKQKRRKINIDERGEWLLPEGSYSMCPVLRADQMIEETAESAETPAPTVEELPPESTVGRQNLKVIDFTAAKAKREAAAKLEAAKEHFLKEILPYLSQETLLSLAKSIMGGRKEDYQAEMTRALMEAAVRKG